MTFSIPELIERKRRLEAEVAEIDRTIEAAALRSAMGKARKVPDPLTFGKNVVTWGNGQAIPLKGKGYQFVKTLYEADKMRLEIGILEKTVWRDEVRRGKVIRQGTIRVFICWLSGRLAEANFPYRLIAQKGKERIEVIQNPDTGKPEKKRFQPEIIGVRLAVR